MNRADIKAAIQAEMQLDPGLVSNAERDLFLNAWLEDIASPGIFEKATTIAVSAGQAVVPIPTDVITLAEVRYGERELLPSGRVAYSTLSNPVYFCLEGGNLILLPAPVGADTLSLIYSYRPVPMTLDTDVPDLPYHWHFLGVLYGVFRSHRKNGNIAMAREYQNEYELKKAEKMRELLTAYNSRVRRIHVVDTKPRGTLSYLEGE